MANRVSAPLGTRASSPRRGQDALVPRGAAAKPPKPLSANDLKPVIVAGAGPAGLIAAAALIQEGVPVVLCEKHSELNRVSKASTFHPASLEVLNRLSLVDILLAKGVRVEQVQYRSVTEGLVAEFSMNVLSRLTQFPYRIHLEQAQLTEVILASSKRVRCSGFVSIARCLTSKPWPSRGGSRSNGRWPNTNSRPLLDRGRWGPQQNTQRPEHRFSRWCLRHARTPHFHSD